MNETWHQTTNYNDDALNGAGTIEEIIKEEKDEDVSMLRLKHVCTNAPIYVIEKNAREKMLVVQ
jgi:hypothetical protein